MNRSAVIRRILSSVLLLGLITIATPRLTLADAILVLSEFQSCEIVDDVPRLHTLTIWHALNAGSVAVRFKLSTNPGMTMSYVSETHAWPNTVGNMRDGMSICYGSCQQGDIVLGTITYQGYGTSNSCAQFIMAPHPDAEALDVIGCANELEAAHTLHFEVRESQSVGCNLCVTHMDSIGYGEPHAFGCAPLPVSSPTWGAIKALYR